MNVNIGVSNRHVHLTYDDYMTLFDGKKFDKVKDLVQTGEYATSLKVSIKTDKATINNVRVLGPFRNYTQVEISKTDSYQLGIDPPIRNSGDIEDSAEVCIIGPNGIIEKKCCIIATRHIHINHETREKLGLLDKKHVKVRLGDEKKAVLEDVYIKETQNGVFEMHIDTDDANANLVKNGDVGEILF
ncbi:MAG: phosphate propanoyltransferase [Bacilli bacterium]